MAEVNPPYVLQNASHGAELFRQAISTLIDPGGGVVAPGGLLVTQHEAPNMTVNVFGGTPEQGGIWIPGTSLPDTQGLYFCWNDATKNLAIGPADAANPRIDQVVALVEDEAIEGVGNEWKLEVQAGVPEPGATLENGKGHAAAPASSIVLAWVLVPAKAVTITNVDIRNLAPVLPSRLRLAGPNQAFKALAIGAKHLASATRPTRVSLSIGSPSEKAHVQVIVGGNVVYNLFCAGGSISNTWTPSFIVQPGEEWEVRDIEGGAVFCDASYFAL